MSKFCFVCHNILQNKLLSKAKYNISILDILSPPAEYLQVTLHSSQREAFPVFLLLLNQDWFQTSVMFWSTTPPLTCLCLLLLSSDGLSEPGQPSETVCALQQLISSVQQRAQPLRQPLVNCSHGADS